MPLYRVLHTHILHDGALYAPDDVIDLSEEEASALSVSPLPEGEREKTVKGKGRK